MFLFVPIETLRVELPPRYELAVLNHGQIQLRFIPDSAVHDMLPVHKRLCCCRLEDYQLEAVHFELPTDGLPLRLHGLLGLRPNSYRQPPCPRRQHWNNPLSIGWEPNVEYQFQSQLKKIVSKFAYTLGGEINFILT